MKLNKSMALSVSLLAALLAGCASDVKLDQPAPVESRTGKPANAGSMAATPSPGGQTSGTAQSQVATVDLAKPMDGSLDAAGRIVYFDFDSFVIKDEYKSVIEANAKRLNANRAKHVVVEGHTDERGGREYNLALGQKRAEAVTRTLALLGVGEGQLEAVSFGKERPAVQGSDEEAWAKNRRAELKDR